MRLVKYIVLFSLIFVSQLSLASEFVAGHLGSPQAGVSYSMSIEYGEMAERSRYQIDMLPAEFKTYIPFSVPGADLEVKVSKHSKQDLVKAGIWNSINQKLFSEIRGKTAMVQVLRHSTFLLAAGSSIYVWSISGYAPHQIFMGASLSVAINALFIYLEDFFDYKVYRNQLSKRLAGKTVESFKKAKLNFQLGLELSKMKLREISDSMKFNHESIQRITASLQKTYAKLQDYMSVENLKKSEVLSSMYYEIEEKGGRKRVKVYDRLEQQQIANEQWLKTFMERFFSITAINSGIIVVYELIKKGIPLDFAAAEIMFDRVVESVVGVMFIGLAYTLIRGQLKDLYKQGLVKEGVVRLYSFSSRVILAAAYVSVFTEWVSVSTAMAVLGVPGWTIALGMILGVHKPLVNKWMKYKAQKNAKLKGNLEAQSLGNEKFEVVWNINNYRYLEPSVLRCNGVSFSN
jgi:hypothetical protein